MPHAAEIAGLFRFLDDLGNAGIVRHRLGEGVFGNRSEPAGEGNQRVWLQRLVVKEQDLVFQEGSVYKLYAWTCDGGCEASPG